MRSQFQKHIGYGLIWAVMGFYLLGTDTLAAQQALSGEEIDEYRAQAQQLVSFLQFTLNTIGDPDVPVKEKDIIINQSYLKFFESDKVQIEDDLVEQRDVPVNKDVQAYLKDIDFFFQKVTFEFTVEEITEEINEKDQLFFKIQLNRNLQGITIEGDTVNTNRVRYIEINLDELEPYVNGPFTPDLATPISEMAAAVKEHGWPDAVEVALIGSCTNSSYEDLSRAASVARQALEKGIKPKAKIGINPGSEQVRYTASRDGLLEIFEDLNAKFL